MAFSKQNNVRLLIPGLIRGIPFSVGVIVAAKRIPASDCLLAVALPSSLKLIDKTLII